MGLFDLVAPVLSFADSGLALALPDLVRLLLWAVLSVGLGYLLYRRLNMNAPENDGGLISAISPLPLAIALLPGIFIATWVSNNFEYETPKPGAGVNMEVHSMVMTDTSGLKSPPRPRVDKFKKQWPVHTGRLVYRDTGSSAGASLPASPVVPFVTKKNWWNAFFGNPVGYIPRDFAIEKITFDVQRRKMISSNSYWLSNWKLWFVLALIASWLGIGRIFSKTSAG